MDRNGLGVCHYRDDVVALRKESVDRNITCGQLPTTKPPSLSARRAWIEMIDDLEPSMTSKVALRKESVDRNLFLPLFGSLCWLSLSARRAWIEMDVKAATGLFTSSRSPQGERG